MRLITRFELATKTTNELRGMLRECFNAMAKSTKDSPELCNALASIENVQREMNQRMKQF
jgi:hypothetical protein